MKVGKYGHISQKITGPIMTMEEWNATGKRWSSKVLAIQRNKAKLFLTGKDAKGQPKSPHTYRRGKKAGQTEYKLSDTGGGGYIFKLRHEQKEYFGTEFKPPIHGIFREWGVGNGQPRDPRKMRRAYRKKRTQSDWISYTMEKNSEELADKAAEYTGDKVLVNTFGVKYINLK